MDISLLLQLAFGEDFGPGDITSEAIFAGTGPTLAAAIIAKEAGVLSGLSIAQAAFQYIDPKLEWTSAYQDAAAVAAGARIAEIKGRAAAILKGERVVLNILQYLSGIASTTAQYVEAVRGTRAKIYDTRKTLPGWRALAKKAVRDGGGKNHRMGLYDQFLIKENHIAACGGIRNAIAACRRYKPNFFLEIEVRNASELEEALLEKPDAILLDHFSLAELQKAVAQVNGQCLLEASGDVRLETVRAIAETGVDRISVGALTHSPKALDLSLLFENQLGGKKTWQKDFFTKVVGKWAGELPDLTHDLPEEKQKL